MLHSHKLISGTSAQMLGFNFKGMSVSLQKSKKNESEHLLDHYVEQCCCKSYGFRMGLELYSKTNVNSGSFVVRSLILQ